MRLFFALWPPADAAASLAAEADALSRGFGGIATRRETIHLTLAFLGEVDEARLPAVVEAARRVASAPFELAIDRIGYWRHNRLLWGGFSAPPPELESLVGQLRERLRGASVACDETKRFVPHLTLVRKVPDRRDAGEPPAIAPIVWPCGEFVLVHSRLATGGSDYSVREAFPLGA